MELKIGYEVIESYKRLSYKVWFAFAEFVDNSTQSFRNNQELLEKVFNEEKSILTVEIDYSMNDDWVMIQDNSIGMNKEDLTKALTIGKKPENALGRSKYGMGLKTAAFWFGDKWEIITKKYGEEKEYSVYVDIAELLEKQIQKNQLETINDRELSKDEKSFIDNFNDLKLVEKTVEKAKHYTILRISKLNQNIAGQTVSKTKEYLRSMYRYDIMEGKLILIFRKETLRWRQNELLDRILDDDTGNKYLRNFVLDVKGKKVTGWAGILEKGSRKYAGFSLLQSKRVIQGWPDSYRPPKLFGDQEGGTNNLVNQRLFGEIFLDGFTVSHTKDEILFSGDEEDVLDANLFEVLADYKKAAEEYRKPDRSDDGEENVDFKSMVTHVFKGMQDPRFAVAMNDRDVLPQEIIQESNEEYFTRLLQTEVKDTYTAHIADIKITVIINGDATIYEPYLIIRFRAVRNEVGVVINKNHPHWKTMETPEVIFYFIKHCIYDGLSEWKANWLIGALDPETIKMIKDRLLRQELFIV